MDSLTKILLGENLSQQERIALKNMSHHEGFPVLKKLFGEACALVNADMVKADPEAPNYDQIVKTRQQRARTVNEFCEAIRKSFEANIFIGDEQAKKEKTNERNNSSATN